MTRPPATPRALVYTSRTARALSWMNLGLRAAALSGSPATGTRVRLVRVLALALPSRFRRASPIVARALSWMRVGRPVRAHEGQRLGRAWQRLMSVTLVAAVAAGCTSGGTEGDDQQAGQVVQFAADKRVAAPEVKGDLLEGGTFDLAAHKGKVVVLNFWASWCAPCRIEVADLEAVHQELSEVEFVGLNTYDDKDKALAFIENKATYPSVLDTSGKLAMGFRQVPPNTLPATIIIDADGKIAVVIRRTTTKDELKQLVNAVVAERG